MVERGQPRPGKTWNPVKEYANVRVIGLGILHGGVRRGSVGLGRARQGVFKNEDRRAID